MELLLVSRVGEGNKEVTSVIGIDVIGNPLLILSVVPDAVSFSGSVDLCGHLIDVRIGVHVLPERLSVVWIVSTSVVLFGTIVVEWNTSSCESKGKS